MSFSPMFPSWHSYGMTGSVLRIVSGIPNVQGETAIAPPYTADTANVLDCRVFMGTSRTLTRIRNTPRLTLPARRQRSRMLADAPGAVNTQYLVERLGIIRCARCRAGRPREQPPSARSL